MYFKFISTSNSKICQCQSLTVAKLFYEFLISCVYNSVKWLYTVSYKLYEKNIIGTILVNSTYYILSNYHF